MYRYARAVRAEHSRIVRIVEQSSTSQTASISIHTLARAMQNAVLLLLLLILMFLCCCIITNAKCVYQMSSDFNLKMFVCFYVYFPVDFVIANKAAQNVISFYIIFICTVSERCNLIFMYIYLGYFSIAEMQIINLRTVSVCRKTR